MCAFDATVIPSGGLQAVRISSVGKAEFVAVCKQVLFRLERYSGCSTPGGTQGKGVHHRAIDVSVREAVSVPGCKLGHALNPILDSSLMRGIYIAVVANYFSP